MSSGDFQKASMLGSRQPLEIEGPPPQSSSPTSPGSSWLPAPGKLFGRNLKIGIDFSSIGKSLYEGLSYLGSSLLSNFTTVNNIIQEGSRDLFTNTTVSSAPTRGNAKSQNREICQQIVTDIVTHSLPKGKTLSTEVMKHIYAAAEAMHGLDCLSDAWYGPKSLIERPMVYWSQRSEEQKFKTALKAALTLQGVTPVNASKIVEIELAVAEDSRVISAKKAFAHTNAKSAQGQTTLNRNTNTALGTARQQYPLGKGSSEMIKKGVALLETGDEEGHTQRATSQKKYNLDDAALDDVYLREDFSKQNPDIQNFIPCSSNGHSSPDQESSSTSDIRSSSSISSIGDETNRNRVENIGFALTEYYSESTNPNNPNQTGIIEI